MSAEYRRNARKRATDFIQVVNTMTDEVVGRIEDLSMSGMMLVVEKALTNDALFQFRFSLPSAHARSRAIEVGAHELWSTPLAGEQKFLCGFRFIDISPEDEALLSAWVHPPSAD